MHQYTDTLDELMHYFSDAHSDSSARQPVRASEHRTFSKRPRSDTLPSTRPRGRSLEMEPFGLGSPWVRSSL